MAKYKMNVSLLTWILLCSNLFVIAVFALVFVTTVTSDSAMDAKNLPFLAMLGAFLLVITAFFIYRIYTTQITCYEIDDRGLKLNGLRGENFYKFAELKNFTIVKSSLLRWVLYSELATKYKSPFAFSMNDYYLPNLFAQSVIAIETTKESLTKLKILLVVDPQSREQFIAELKKRNIPELK